MLDAYNERNLAERHKVSTGDLLIASHGGHWVRFFKVLKRTARFITVQPLKEKCIAAGSNSKRVFRRGNSIFWSVPSDEEPCDSPFRSKIDDEPEDSNWDCTFKNGDISARLYTIDQFKCCINDNNEWTPDWIVSKEEFLREFEETDGELKNGFAP